MVEFALVGGLFFFLVFSIVNAGFFLYGRAAVQHAADVGVALLSTEGNCMAYTPGGLCLSLSSNCPNYDGGATSANADAVAICAMDQDGFDGTPLITVSSIAIWEVTEQSNGTFTTVTSGCSGPCEDEYGVNGNTILDNWPPSSREVVSSPAFAELQVTFSYALLATSGNITMTTDNVFRMEPQQ
ncbi:MAG: TadE family protein [Candidatus Dormibacteria bacterium]|jgi:Flp pilus assembly protein TadG